MPVVLHVHGYKVAYALLTFLHLLFFFQSVNFRFNIKTKEAM